MRMNNLIPAVLLGLALVGLASLPAAEETKPATDKASIEKLVEQLGSDSFAERQKAFKTLDEIGKPALEALQKAAKSTDAEVRKRSMELVSKISKRVESAELLTAKQVHLVYKNTPIKEAVEDLKKKTGYLIVLHDPENKLKDKKVTLDTGKTSFWTALDKFCEAAGVVEGDPNANPMGVPPGMGLPGVVPGIGIAPAVPIPVAPVKAVPIKRVPAKAPAKKDATEKKEAPATDEKKDADKKKEEEAKAEAERRAADAKKAEAAKEAAKRAAAIRAAAGGGGGVAIAVPAVMPLPPMMGGWVQVQPGQITLVPGKSEKRPTDSSSSMRVRQADRKTHPYKAGDKEIGLVLEVTPEPRLRWHQLLGVQVDKALDDNDQKLVQTKDENPMGGGMGGFGGFGGGIMILPGGGIGAPGFPGRGGVWFGGSANGLSQYATMRLKQGEKASKTLKELSGTISAQLQSEPEKIIVVDNVQKAAGKSVKGGGGEIKVDTVTKLADGTLQISFTFEQPANIIPETMVPGVEMPAMNPVIGGRIRGGIRVVPAPAPVPLPVPVPPPAPKDKAVPAVPPPIGGMGGVGIALPVVPQKVYYATNGLTLQDDKGNVLSASIQYNWKRGGGGVVIGFPGGGMGGMGKMEYIATIKPEKGKEPAKLVFTGRRVVEVTVPFKLTNVDVK